MTNAIVRPRSRGQRNVAIPILAALAVCLMVVGALGFAAHRAGSIEVSVREYGPGGTDIEFAFPAAFAETALHMIPGAALDEIAEQIGDYMPLLRAMRDELEDLPDCVLVEVISDDENVLIAKRKGRMIIEVQSSDEEVRLAVPFGVISSALSKMAEAADGDRRFRHGS